MAFAPLQCRGNLSIDGTDVSDEVIGFMFKGAAETVDIPATLGRSKGYFAGDDDYEVEISFLADTDAAATTMLLWNKLGDTVTVVGTFREGAVSASNPQWTGTAIVTGVGLGGDVNSTAQDSQTFKLQGPPTIATS